MGPPTLTDSEFTLIDRYFKRTPRRADVLLGIGDDAALVRVPADRDLVIAVDTLLEGVHFPLATAAFDIGYKALAVNLSDLAAMAAEPAWLTLALTVPADDRKWLSAFAEGLFSLADRYGMELIGGDTSRGPLSVSVQVAGYVKPGKALRRHMLAPEQVIMVSGTLGDAALALEGLKSGGVVDEALVRRLNRPEPRVELALQLTDIASAAIDISDGLLADLGHMLERCDCGARLELEQLPVSDAFARAAPADPRPLQLAGGDDYELCFCVEPGRVTEAEAAAARLGVRVTSIGRIEPTPGIRCLQPDGRLYRPAVAGWDHFG